MRIGIDARALTGRYTGDRTYWLNLIRAHAEDAATHGEFEYILYSRLPIPAQDVPCSPNIRMRTIPASNDRLWTMLAFPRALRQDEVDLAHTQYTTPLRAPCPMITTVHDISFRLYPEWFPRKHRLLLNISVPGSMRRAALVITDTESSRRDIQRIYRLPDERIAAIPLAAAPEYRPIDPATARQVAAERYGITDRYVLSVGVLQPRKNLPLLMEAFAHARRKGGIPHKLVLTGKRGWMYEDLWRQAARLGINESLHFTDYVPDADLPALYSAADLMAFPSLYEGFGLPPLEAMACGTPTIVSDAPAMPEVAGEGAMVLPVMDSARWGDAIHQLLTNESLLAEWSWRGKRRAEEFSWQRTSSCTRAMYHRVLDPVAANV